MSKKYVAPKMGDNKQIEVKLKQVLLNEIRKYYQIICVCSYEVDMYNWKIPNQVPKNIFQPLKWSKNFV